MSESQWDESAMKAADGKGEGEVIDEYAYENVRRKCYEGGATFVPVCEKCFRFVKADDTIFVNEAVGLIDQPNATCKKCGRTKMLFEGFV